MRADCGKPSWGIGFYNACLNWVEFENKTLNLRGLVEILSINKIVISHVVGVVTQHPPRQIPPPKRGWC